MQQEVLNALKGSTKKNPMSRGQIAAKLKCSPILVSIALNKLVKYDEVGVIEIDRRQAAAYNSCHGMRLYYSIDCD